MRVSYSVLVVSFFFTFHLVCSNPRRNYGSTNRPTIDLPAGFLLGAGTSAFQIEGASATDGKTESYIEWIFSNVFGNPSANASVSSNSYYNYKKDIEVLEYIGLDVYRFSMSWPRILPTGYTHTVNKEAIKYYHAVLDELERIGVQPVVLLNHFDHPLILEEIGGWQNESMVHIFAEYARFVFEEFGHRVKNFVTFNEPNMFCDKIYSYDWYLAGGRVNYNASLNLTRAYTCGHNMLKAHAEVYHIYDKEFRRDQEGLISISIECEHFYSKDADDKLSADIGFQFFCGWFAHPIFSKTGDYPDIVKQRARENSMFEGLKESRLPTFSDDWIQKIRGSADYFALSHYSSHLVEPAPVENGTYPSFFMPGDARLAVSNDPNWIPAPKDLYIVPEGLRDLLNKLKEEYDNPPVYVIENGFADDGRLDDRNRTDFIYSYMGALIKAVVDDGCDVRAYVYWSLIDSYEFDSGYTDRFGLTHVDFDHPNRTRTLRQSADWLREVVRRQQLFI